MFYAFDDAAATVIAAFITSVGIILVAYMNKVHKDNRSDHAVVTKRIDEVHSDIKDVKKDLIDVKIDVATLKVQQSNAEKHINRLEGLENVA